MHLRSQLQRLVPRGNGWRAYGTAKSASRLGRTISLDHFIQRGRVLSLWREILRSTKSIQDPARRTETRQMARAEFERNRKIEDISHIRYLISTGKTEWQAMERYVHGL